MYKRQAEASLQELSPASRARQWYARHQLETAFQRFVAYEHQAAVINIWQLLFVPGLLQTEEYARAVTALSLRRSPDDPDVSSLVKLRMDRQRAFRDRLGGADPPRIVALIDESVLRRPVGGPDCLRRQLDHLLGLAADTETYTIGVLPLGLAHAGVRGTFELLEFTAPERDDVLFVEAVAGASVLTTNRTPVFRDIIQDLMGDGRVGDEAAELVRSVRAALR